MARQKRLLVTGYNEFIGRNMVDWLRQEDWIVEGWAWSNDKEDWPHVADYDWVIHCFESKDHLQTLDNALAKNFDFSCWLFLQCNQYGTNLQFISSHEVYGKSKDFSEFADCKPENNFAWSKYLFDRWVFQQPLNIIVQGFRHFNVYGQYMNLAGFCDLHRFRNEARTLGCIHVPENAERIKKDYVWVGDVCKLHIDFIKSVVGSGIWNCGSGLAHCILDVAEEIAQQEGVEIEYSLTSSNLLYNCAELTQLKKTVGKRKWLNVFEYITYEKNK